MNVPDRRDIERAAGVSAFDGRDGAAGADTPDPRFRIGRVNYRIRLVYEVEGCDDPFDALAELVAGLADLSPGVHARLVDSGVM